MLKYNHEFFENYWSIGNDKIKSKQTNKIKEIKKKLN